jgi:hypothetical protein
MCSNMWITCMNISFTHARLTREDGTMCQTTPLRDIGYVYVLIPRETRSHYTFSLSIASRCTSQASQSMGGRMGHTGQKQRQRQRQNDMEAGGSLSLRVEEVLVVRKTGNYVAYISARVLYVHIQSTSRSRVEEARPRKETNLEVINGRPGFPATLHPLCMFNRRR